MPLPPGKNYWFRTAHAARRAAWQAARRMGAGFRVKHHLYPALGLRHYHVEAPDGRTVRLRFFYIQVLDESALHEGHGAKYRAERQKFLRGLLNDLNQPAFVRGWVQNQLKRLERIQRAQQSGRRAPGGNKRYLKGIPGFDVGHSNPLIDDAATFRVENASTNRARPGLARRLKLGKRYYEDD